MEHDRVASLCATVVWKVGAFRSTCLGFNLTAGNLGNIFEVL